MGRAEIYTTCILSGLILCVLHPKWTRKLILCRNVKIVGMNCRASLGVVRVQALFVAQSTLDKYIVSSYRDVLYITSANYQVVQ